MSDLIERQAAIDAIFSEPLYKSGMKKRDADVVIPAIYEKIKSLPSAQPEKRTEERTETHACDCISRQAMFDTAAEYEKQLCEILGDENDLVEVVKILKHRLIALPSAQPEPSHVARDIATIIENEQDMRVIERNAQPEIIRCGQCKYAEVADKEDAQDGYTCQFHRGSIWFSGSYCSWAERRTE